MVDALWEAWRVLVPDGILVDLRPLPSSGCPIDAVTQQRAVQIGQVDADGSKIADLAADEAMRHVVNELKFVQLHEARFDFEYYWDTVEELAGFMETSSRFGNIRPSYAELAEIHRERTAQDNVPLRLRATRPMLLATYRKMPPMSSLASAASVAAQRPGG